MWRLHSLPGSVAERDLQESWIGMLPELLRHSTASRLLAHFPNEVDPTAPAMREWADWPTETPPPTAEDNFSGEDRDGDALDDATLRGLGL